MRENILSWTAEIEGGEKKVLEPQRMLPYLPSSFTSCDSVAAPSIASSSCLSYAGALPPVSSAEPPLPVSCVAASAMATVGSLTCDNAKLVSDSSIKSGFLGSSTQLLSAPVAAKIERLSVSCLPRTVVSSMKGKLFQRRGQMPPKSLTIGASYLSPGYLDRTYAVGRDTRVNAGRDYYDDYEEEQIDLAEHKMLQKGAPGTYQAIVKSVMPVGFFLSMPSGRTAYLPARDLGVSGGVVLLEKVFKPGQELTVRIMTTGGGRDIVSMKKPEFAPPDDMEIITRPLKGQQNQPPPRSRQPYPRERRY